MTAYLLSCFMRLHQVFLPVQRPQANVGQKYKCHHKKESHLQDTLLPSLHLVGSTLTLCKCRLLCSPFVERL